MAARRALLAALAVAALVLPASPVGAQPAQPAQPLQPLQSVQCAASIDGQSVDGHDNPDHPIELDAHAQVTVVAVDPAGTDFLRIDVVLAFTRTTLVDAHFSPRQEYERTVNMEEISDFGVGLYHLEVQANGCELTVWIDITGEPALSTPFGLASAALAVVGASILVVALLLAARGKGGLLLAMLGGAIAGLGAIGFAQQSGWVGLTDKVVVTWTAIPAVAGGVLRQAVAFGGRRRLEIPSLDSGTGAEAAPPIEPPTEPPRTAYARMDAPDAVVADTTFELVVGLAAEPQPGVIGPALVRPASSVGDYTLSIQVVADGFALLPGGHWRRELPVTAAAPYPSTTYRLRATPRPGAEVWAGSIQALFSVDGQTMGMAVRSLAVVARTEQLTQAALAPTDAAATVVGVPTERDAPDLTVRILLAESESNGRLLWTFENPHGVAVPDERVATDIGRRPERFAAQLIEGVREHRDQAGLLPFLAGVGVTVADQMPPAFFELLVGVASASGHRVPTVLLLSEEPYVPWELAILDPPLDPGAPPYLAAQAAVGRWVLGHRRPKLPPPTEVDVQAVAVVSGVYDDAAWRLVEAEDEAATLRRQYGAEAVDARAGKVFECLAGRPAADLLHFALHGVYNPEDGLEGLILVDGSKLDPLAVRGTELDRRPFVFLNACQVGSGNRVLGDYAGLAEAFLHAGASGAVAPLWSVEDAAAKDLALRFYQRVLHDGDPPAVVLMDERRTFAAPGRDGAATCLAYQFFGHPAMTLRRGRG